MAALETGAPVSADAAPALLTGSNAETAAPAHTGHPITHQHISMHQGKVLHTRTFADNCMQTHVGHILCKGRMCGSHVAL